MQDRQNRDALQCRYVVDGERKTPQPGAAYIGSDQLVPLRHALNKAETDIDSSEKLRAQPGCARFVPLGGQQHVGFGRLPDQKGRHLPDQLVQPLAHLFPGNAGFRVSPILCQSSFQLLEMPLWHRNLLVVDAVPEVLHKLEAL